MENLYYSPGDSYDTFLGIKIVDLSLDKKYQDFRIKLDSNDNWLYVSINPNKSTETNVAIFDNLQQFTVYKFVAQFMINNEWIDIQTCSFQTMFPTPNNTMPFFNNKYKYASGTIVEKSKNSIVAVPK